MSKREVWQGAFGKLLYDLASTYIHVGARYIQYIENSLLLLFIIKYLFLGLVPRRVKYGYNLPHDSQLLNKYDLDK